MQCKIFNHHIFLHILVVRWEIDVEKHLETNQRMSNWDNLWVLLQNELKQIMCLCNRLPVTKNLTIKLKIDLHQHNTGSIRYLFYALVIHRSVINGLRKKTNNKRNILLKRMQIWGLDWKQQKIQTLKYLWKVCKTIAQFHFKKITRKSVSLK